MIDWYIEAIAFGNCNCGYGCPCQFEDKPTHGHCRGFEVFRIDQGHFADVSLDGFAARDHLCLAGPIYEGKGEMQVIIDERADAAAAGRARNRAQGRRDRGGEDALVGVPRHVRPGPPDPVQADRVLVRHRGPDRPRRRPGCPGARRVGRSSARPPASRTASGSTCREGSSSTLAEVGSATTKATAAVALDLSDSYGQFNMLRHSGTGIVR